jgi:hypothetical protein
VVLIVVDAHRLFVYVGLQRVVVVGERRKLESYSFSPFLRLRIISVPRKPFLLTSSVLERRRLAGSRPLSRHARER